MAHLSATTVMNMRALISDARLFHKGTSKVFLCLACLQAVSVVSPSLSLHALDTNPVPSHYETRSEISNNVLDDRLFQMSPVCEQDNGSPWVMCGKLAGVWQGSRRTAHRDTHGFMHGAALKALFPVLLEFHG